MNGDVATPDALDKLELKALLQRRDGPGLRHLAIHLALIAGAAALVLWAGWSWWVWPAMLLEGILVIFLFAPLHETIHRSAFKTRRLNILTSWLCGAVMFLPPNFFRAFHTQHHAYTQDPARDPELAAPRPATWRTYLWHVSGLPLWRWQIGTLFQNAMGRCDTTYVTPRIEPAVVREARILLALYALLAAGSLILWTDLLLKIWLIPILLGQPFLRLYLLAEHWGMPMVPEMLNNSRTTLTNPVMRFLAWNMPYHAEHHAFSAVPFHNLPKVHAKVKARIGTKTPGYLAFHRQVWRTLSAQASP